MLLKKFVLSNWIIIFVNLIKRYIIVIPIERDKLNSDRNSEKFIFNSYIEYITNYKFSLKSYNISLPMQ